MSPRTQKQFQVIREGKKTLIMDVALEHFAKEGYFNTTISHIAKHARISKGLMYNYFESKEALLSAILKRSIIEIYKYFDINKDGYLTEEEFEFFVRRVFQILKEKKTFWRLLVQILMQKEVREEFLKSFYSSISSPDFVANNPEEQFLNGIFKTMTDYFARKEKRNVSNYDPHLELNMFFLTIKGFAVTYIYIDEVDEEFYDKTINRIIELYK